jgi:hypothetical protein
MDTTPRWTYKVDLDIDVFSQRPMEIRVPLSVTLGENALRWMEAKAGEDVLPLELVLVLSRASVRRTSVLSPRSSLLIV